MKISLCIPIHDTPNTAFFLSRLLNSIHEQSYKDYEIVITKEGPFARNHNAAIMKAKGEIIQMLQMDDYLAHPEALHNIAVLFESNPDKQWQISACLHDYNGQIGNYHEPKWTDDIYTGNNRLGSVSTLAMRRETALLFEEPLSWLVDCHLYWRLYLKYGLPILSTVANVVISTRDDRLTNVLPNSLKMQEYEYMMKLYGNKSV